MNKQAVREYENIRDAAVRETLMSVLVWCLIIIAFGITVGLEMLFVTGSRTIASSAGIWNVGLGLCAVLIAFLIKYIKIGKKKMPFQEHIVTSIVAENASHQIRKPRRVYSDEDEEEPIDIGGEK